MDKFEFIAYGYLLIGVLAAMIFVKPIYDEHDEYDVFNMFEKVLMLILAWLPMLLAAIRNSIQKAIKKREAAK
jgi:hypothetical protein